MSFVAVFTATATGFALLVPIFMVAALAFYGAQLRRPEVAEARARSERTVRPAQQPATAHLRSVA